MAIVDRVLDLVEPLVAALDLDLVDVEYNGGVLRITVDQEGGLNLDKVAELSRMVSREMDEQDPISAAYTLEVTSPGLERRLRKFDHYQRSLGEDITVKLGSHVEGERRLSGKLTAVDDTTVTVVTDDGESQVISMADITKARTVFDWGPTPKSGADRKDPKQAYADSKNAKGAGKKNVTKRAKKNTETDGPAAGVSESNPKNPKQKAPDRKAAAS